MNVVVLHKGGSPLEANNYRPISLLLLPGKLLESIIYSRLYYYLEDNSLLTDNQWGLRLSGSTIDAAPGLLDQIQCGLNSKLHVSVLFVELQKALDFIDHSVLAEKLDMCRVCGVELECFQSTPIAKSLCKRSCFKLSKSNSWCSPRFLSRAFALSHLY